MGIAPGDLPVQIDHTALGVEADQLVPLFGYACNHTVNTTDFTLGPANWQPAVGGPCKIVTKTVDNKTSVVPSLYGIYIYAQSAKCDARESNCLNCCMQ